MFAACFVSVVDASQMVSLFARLNCAAEQLKVLFSMDDDGKMRNI